MTDMTIANTILAQLGGNKFIAMTGAKNLIGGANYLSLQMPTTRIARNGINCLRVTLTPADDYKVEFIKIRGMNIKTVSEFDGIYADMLRDLFTRETGLETSLGTMRG